MAGLVICSVDVKKGSDKIVYGEGVSKDAVSFYDYYLFFLG
jgi:hypothetical protein